MMCKYICLDCWIATSSKKNWNASTLSPWNWTEVFFLVSSILLEWPQVVSVKLIELTQCVGWKKKKQQRKKKKLKRYLLVQINDGDGLEISISVERKRKINSEMALKCKLTHSINGRVCLFVDSLFSASFSNFFCILLLDTQCSRQTLFLHIHSLSFLVQFIFKWFSFDLSLASGWGFFLKYSCIQKWVSDTKYNNNGKR